MPKEEMNEKKDKLFQASVDSEFLHFLETNFPSDFMKISVDDAKDDVLYSILQKHQEKYRIWNKIPQWIKNYYNDRLPPEIWTIHEPYNEFVQTLEQVLLQANVYDGSRVNNIIYDSEYARELYKKYRDVGYSEVNTAKMIQISVKDKELFESGEICTFEGKFKHKAHLVEEMAIMNDEMSPEEEVARSLKELQRLKVNIARATDEEKKKELEQKQKELALYLGKKVVDIDDVELVEAVDSSLNKILDDKVEDKEVRQHIGKVEKIAKSRKIAKSKRKRKKEVEAKVEPEEIEKTKDLNGEEPKDISLSEDEKRKERVEASIFGQTDRVIDGGEHEEFKRKADTYKTGIFGSLAKVIGEEEHGMFERIAEEFRAGGREQIRKTLEEHAPKNGYFARRGRERAFKTEEERKLARDYIEGKECDFEILRKKTRDDENKRKINSSLGRIRAGKDSDPKKKNTREGAQNKKSVLGKVMENGKLNLFL